MSYNASGGLEKDSSSLCECTARQNDDDKLWSKQKKNKELAACVGLSNPAYFSLEFQEKLSSNSDGSWVLLQYLFLKF